MAGALRELFAVSPGDICLQCFPHSSTGECRRRGQTIHYMGKLVEQGWSILIFPEGDRSATGEIHKFQPGVGMIASHLGIPVVPVRIVGLDKVLNRSAKWPHPRPGRAAHRPAAGPRRGCLCGSGQPSRRRGTETVIWDWYPMCFYRWRETFIALIRVMFCSELGPRAKCKHVA